MANLDGALLQLEADALCQLTPFLKIIAQCLRNTLCSSGVYFKTNTSHLVAHDREFRRSVQLSIEQRYLIAGHARGQWCRHRQVPWRSSSAPDAHPR